MESPSEEHVDSSQISDAEMADKTTPCSSISPKKPIQLGIVQSSSGVRASTGNLSLAKKSRWDQAPESGENEEELKEAAIQSSNPEESNVKNLIKQFEDISGSSKIESQKSDEGLSSKPSRVKLVRTNFAKPESPLAKPMDVDKAAIETSKIEETDVETTDKSSDVSQLDVIPVSSSKALQIISSNYDSPSDESSQEAENSASSEIKQKTPSDSAYASLERLSQSSEQEKHEDSIKERLSSALCLKDESAPKSESNETDNKNSNLSTSKTEEPNNLFKEDKAEQSVTIDSDACELSIKNSQTPEEGSEVNERALDETVLNESNNSKPDQLENTNAEKNIVDEPSPKIQQISQISDLTCENILNEKIDSQDYGEKTIKHQDIESQKSPNQNVASEMTDNTEVTKTEISSVQAQLEAFELTADSKIDSDKSDNSSETMTHINESVNVDIAEKPSDETMQGETNREDFVNIIQADLKSCTDSTLVPDCTLADELIEQPKDQMLNTESLEDNLVEHRSKRRDDSKGYEDVETITKTEEKECLDENQTDSKEIPAKTVSELFKADHGKDEVNVQLYGNKEVKKFIFKNESAFEIPEGSEDEVKSYNDGVDAKMEQIFSETPENVIGDTFSSKPNIEERPTSFEQELVEESLISEDSAISDKSSKNEEIQTTLETSDSLLEMLQSGGSPEVDALQKDNPNIGKEGKEFVNKLEKCNMDEAVPTIDVVLNENENAQMKSNSEIILEQEVVIESQNINNVVTKGTGSGENSLLKEEITIKHVTEDIKEESTTKVDKVKLGVQIEEDRQTLMRGDLGKETGEEESEIIIEEVDDASVPENSSQLFEGEVVEEHNVNLKEDRADPQANIEVPVCRDIVIEEVDCTEVSSNSKTLQDSNKTKVQSIEVKDVIIKPSDADAKESDQDMPNVSSFECFKTKDIDNIPEMSTPISEVKNEAEIKNPVEVIAMTNELNSIKNKEIVPSESSNQNETFEGPKEFHKAGSAVDLKHTSMEAEGSVEVNQQETIERSIDMLFEMPTGDQLIKPSTLSSANSRKDVTSEVTSETKKLFSEEIQKEMLKLSPEHEAQRKETIILQDPCPSKDSYSSEGNDSKVGESCEIDLGMPEVNNEGKTSNVPIDLEVEKEISMPSDDSEIATIQAIDTFLEEDMGIKSYSESNSKSEKLTVESVEKNNVELTNEDDSSNFPDSTSTNERTNAEDVMLGVEGDLDLGNSLAYDTKKLDLSPSSPAISEENYDLPGDSYDKESLVKEQENTNLLSDVLDSESVSKESDSQSLQISKEKEAVELSTFGTDTVSDDTLKDQSCEENVLKGNETGMNVAKFDLDLSPNKIQPLVQSSKTEMETDRSKAIENPNTGNIMEEKPLLVQKHEDIEGKPKNIDDEEPSKVHGNQAKGKVCKKIETSEIEDVFPETSKEPKPNVSSKKDANLDFESLIPSSTVLSKEQVELDISSVIMDSCKTVKDSPGNLVNVSKEQSEKIVKQIPILSDKNVMIEDIKSCEIKESSIEFDRKVSKESLSPKIDNTSAINTVKEDGISSVDDPCEDNKTSKRPSSTVKESDHDEGKIMSDTIREPKRTKITNSSEEIEFKPSVELSTLKNPPNTKEKSPPSTETCLTSKDLLNIDSDSLHNAEEKSSLVTSLSQDKALLIPNKSKQSKENTPDESDLSTDNKSRPPQDSSIEIADEAHSSIESNQNKEQKLSLDPPSNQTCASGMENVESHSHKEGTESIEKIDKQTVPNQDTEIKSAPGDLKNQTPAETIPPVMDQAGKLSKSATAKEIPAPVRVSARQKQRQAAAAAALAAKEKVEVEKSPGQGPMIKKGKKSLSPTKELHIKISGKSPESGKQSPLASQKSPKTLETKMSVQMSPKKMNREVGQDKLEPITLKLSKEENPVIVRSSSLSPKKIIAPHSPQGKTLGYTLKIGKDSTTIIPKDSSPSPTRRESSPGTGGTKADLSGKVGYLIKDTGLTITPVAPAETQEQKLNKITLKLSKAGGHPEIKQEKSETWKAIRKLGEIDIVPVEGKGQTDTSKRKDKSGEGSPEKKLKLTDVTMEPSTSSGVSKLQGLLTQAPLNQSDSSEEGKFIGFGSPTEKVAPAQQQQQPSYDIGMIRHDDSPQPPRKRGRPRKITSPDDVVHSVSVPHSLAGGLTAKDILAASLQHQSLQQHIHPSYPQSYQPQEDLDSSQPMVPLFDLFEETYMEPAPPPTIFPDQVQPSTEIIMRSARGRPIGRSRRPRGSGLMRGHERGGPRGRPRGSRGIKRILEEMEAMSYPDPDQPITLENIDAEMGPRLPEHAASELTMALLRKSIEGKKEILEKRTRKSEGSEEGNGDLEAQVREMKEKIEAAYKAELKSPNKEGKKRTPEKLELTKKSPPGLIPLLQRQEERRKSAEGKEAVKRKLSEDKSEEGQKQAKRKSTDEKPESAKPGEGSIDEASKDDSQMEVDQPTTSSEEPSEQNEEKTEPEPPPKPVKPRPKSKAEIKRIKREKDRLRREAKKLAALEALKAPPPNPCEEDTRMSASDPNGDGIDGEGGGIKKNRMEVGDPEGKEFTVEQIAEYQWPLQGGELYMIQEQISTWLGVKSFQRKYPDLKRRRVEMEERTYLCDSGLVAETMCDLGLTAVSSSEVLDIMFQDFPDQYEELRKHMREKQARDIINKQRERKKFEQTLSKSDLKEHAIQSLASWNTNLNRSRNENRKCHLDLQTWTIQYPRSKAAKMTRPAGKLGGYPVALIPGQYADYYKRYTPAELRYFPVNTVLYGPLQPNEMHSTGGSDGSQSESEDSSSSDGTSDSSSEGEGTEEDEKERERGRECKTCGSKKSNEAMLQCSQCSHNIHVSCADVNQSMLTHVRKYQWQCSVCKTCQRCNNAKNESKMLFCDQCDRGYHSYCVGLRRVPAGSWTCELCSADSGGS